MRDGRRLACVAGQASGAAHGQLRRGHCSEAEGRRQSGTNAGGGAGAGPREPAPQNPLLGCCNDVSLSQAVRRPAAPQPPPAATAHRELPLGPAAAELTAWRACQGRRDPRLAAPLRTDWLVTPPSPTPTCRHSPGITAATTQPHRRGTGVPRAELSTPLRGGASACTAPWAPLLRPSQIPQIMENYDAGRAFRPCPQSSASHLAKHLPPRRCAGCSCARWRCTVHSGASAS